MSSAIKQIIENVTVHKKRSASPLHDNQIAYIPTVADDQIECLCFSYLIEGNRTIINQGTQCCFRLRYLNFKSMAPRKAISYKYGVWSIRELVEDNVIFPFLLFINGKFIPWDLISLAIGQENYYAVVDTSSNDTFTSLVRDVQYAQIMNLPSHIVEDDDYDTIDDTVVFTFDEEGLYNPDAETYKIRSTTDANHIVYNFWNSSVGVSAFPVILTTSVKLTSDNIVLFANGLLATGTKDNIVRGFDDEYEYEDGFKSPCLELVKDDDDIGINPVVKFDSELLTIGDGSAEDGVRYDFGVFINTKYTTTVDNINRTDLTGLAPYIQDQNSGTNDPEFLQQLQEEFVMSMDRTKSYAENLADAIQTMLSYNSSLFNEVYEENSNLVIEEWTGADVIAATDEDGLLTLSRQHNSMICEKIIMLVNGELYQYNSLVKYKANKCMIPIQGIEEDDAVEFLRFQNIIDIDGGYITVNEDDGYQYYSSDVINENMVLFSTETDSTDYEYPSDGLQHFPVEYTLDTDDDGLIQITLTNDFYYGKRLKVDFADKFVHYCYTLSATTDPEEYVVDLGNKFMYCNDYTKYMIFYNGRRIGSDQYRLTLPVRTGTPYSRFKIYLTAPIEDGDRLDVMYVPSVMKDVILIPTIPTSGDIVVDKSVLGYGLSTELYMVWVNGKKVPASQVVDIDSTHMRIIADVESTTNVCITKYIADIDELTGVFTETDALWDTIMAQLTYDEIYTLLGITGEELTNTEAVAYEGVDIRTIMYELIREEYIMGAKVDTSGAFVYDYLDVDTSLVETYDSGDNAVLPVADSNQTDNLADVEREWP